MFKPVRFLRSTHFLFGSNLLLSGVIVFFIFSFLAYLSTRYDKKFDITNSSRFTLEPRLSKLLDQLQSPLVITGFYTEVDSSEFFRHFKMIKAHSDSIQLEQFDPITNPAVAKQYKVRQTKSIHFGYNGFSTMITNPNRQKIATAIMKVISKKTSEIYFSVGHGEKRLNKSLSVLKDLLAAANYHATELTISSTSQIPANATILVIAGPNLGFQPQEIDLINNYLATNGKVVLLLEPNVTHNLHTILARYGIKLHQPEIAVGPSANPPSSKKNRFIVPVGPHKKHLITDNFYTTCLFYTARSVSSDPRTRNKEFNALDILRTGADSWAERNDFRTLSYESDKDWLAPSVGVISEYNKSALTVIGDSDFVTNSFLNHLQNGDFFLNLVNYLSGDHLFIPTRNIALTPSHFTLSPSAYRTIYYILTFVLPIGLLVYGFLQWRRRIRGS